MTTAAGKEVPEAAELRQRAPHGASEHNAEARDAGGVGSAPGASGPSPEDKGKKTYGRTPDGTGMHAAQLSLPPLAIGI